MKSKAFDAAAGFDEVSDLLGRFSGRRCRRTVVDYRRARESSRDVYDDSDLNAANPRMTGNHSFA